MSSLATPPKFKIAERVGNRITLGSVEGHIVHLFVLEDDIVRVMVLPGGVLRFPRTWAIAPAEEDVPTEGRDRSGTAAFSRPAYKFSADGETVTIETERIRVVAQLTGFFCRWEINREGQWHRALKDRPTQAYNF